jgi:Crp-like helix-turn-helix domain
LLGALRARNCPAAKSLHQLHFDFCHPDNIPFLLAAHVEYDRASSWCTGVGSLDWKGFEGVTLHGRESAFQKFHQNDLKHWYRLLRRTSGLLNLDLHECVALTMLDLCDDFGIEDSRGTLLTVSFSQKDIASIVGASRPRVTEHLGQMERDHFLVRQGRQFIVNAEKLSTSLAAQAA